jgi:hypothetical protein
MRGCPSLSPPYHKNETRLSDIAYPKLPMAMERDFNTRLDTQDQRFSKPLTKYALKISELETKLGEFKWKLDIRLKDIVLLKFKISVLESGRKADNG